MTMFPLFPEENEQDEHEQDNTTPLPLIVANRWGFPLAHMRTDEGMLYAVQDWMRGLTGENDTRYVLAQFKKTEAGKQTLISYQRLPYKAADGKTYQRDYTTDNGLYLIAQYLRVKEERPMLGEIRRFLAKSGVAMDEIRLDPNKLAGNAKDADKMLNAFIEYHRKRGKDDGWIQTRIEGTIKRNQFTAALTEFVTDVLNRSHYAIATDDVYRNLWDRSAAQLKAELSVPKNGNLHDYQPRTGLYYQGITEEVSAHQLDARQEVTWNEARSIIQTVATIIGRQAAETSQLMQMDVATGKPLLTSG